MLVTSFAMGAAWANVTNSSHLPKTARRSIGHSEFLSRSKEVIVPKDVLLALCAYWAVLNAFAPVLVTGSPYGSLDQQSVGYGHLSHLLAQDLLVSALLRMQEDIVRHMTCSQTLHTEQSYNYALYARLKKALKVTLRTPLFFVTSMTLALHGDAGVLADKGSSGSDSPELRDLHSLTVLHTVIKANPLTALVQELCNCSTVLASAAAFHCTCCDGSLALSVMMLLAHYCPSALSLGDRNSLYPIHHAARKGHSSVLCYLSQSFAYTIPLRDQSHKTALHHAVLSHAHHSLAAVLELAAAHPQTLLAQPETPSAFHILSYAAKHCSAELVKGLREIAEAYLNRMPRYALREEEAEDFDEGSESPGASSSTSSSRKRAGDGTEEGGRRKKKQSLLDSSLDDSLLLLLSAAKAQPHFFG